MADLIIQPSAVGNQRLVIADQAGNTLLKTGDGTTATTELNRGLLQIKQFRKRTIFDLQSSNTTTVLPAPFDGTASITPSTAGNHIRAKFTSTVDHGTTWRSGYYVMSWMSEASGGLKWYGLVGGCTSSWGTSTNTHGNMVVLDGMFNPNTTRKVYVRLYWCGHASGAGRRHGQYFNEATDGANYTGPSSGGGFMVGCWLTLEEWAAPSSTITEVA